MRRCPSDPPLVIDRHLMNYLHYGNDCRSIRDVQLRNRAVVDLISDDPADIDDIDILVCVNTIMRDPRARARFTLWCSELKELTIVDHSEDIQRYLPMAMFIKGLAVLSIECRNFAHGSLDVLLTRLLSLSSFGDMDTMRIAHLSYYYNLLFQVYQGKYKTLILEDCKLSIPTAAEASYLFHSRLERLELHETCLVHIVQSSDLQAPLGATLNCLKVHQYNGGLGAGDDLCTTMKSLSSNGCFANLIYLIIDLKLSYLGRNVSSLMTGRGWLVSLLDQMQHDIQCPRLQQISINSTVNDSYSLLELIHEIIGLQRIESFHDQAQINFLVKFHHFVQHSDLHRKFHYPIAQMPKQKYVLKVIKRRPIVRRMVVGAVLWLKAFHTFPEAATESGIELQIRDSHSFF